MELVMAPSVCEGHRSLVTRMKIQVVIQTREGSVSWNLQEAFLASGSALTSGSLPVNGSFLASGSALANGSLPVNGSFPLSLDAGFEKSGGGQERVSVRMCI